MIFLNSPHFPGHFGYKHFAVTGRVSATRVKDSSADVPRTAADRQVSSVHIHHEHCQYSRDGHHH